MRAVGQRIKREYVSAVGAGSGGGGVGLGWDGQ